MQGARWPFKEKDAVSTALSFKNQRMSAATHASHVRHLPSAQHQPSYAQAEQALLSLGAGFEALHARGSGRQYLAVAELSLADVQAEADFGTGTLPRWETRAREEE